MIEPEKLILSLIGLSFFALISCSDVANDHTFLENLERLDKPNVLFLICDDLNDWVLHPPGHPKVKAPNIDKLRKEGVVFTNAHAAVPVCGSSRICLMSGMYPQSLQAFGFNAYGNAVVNSAVLDTLAGRNAVLPLDFLNNGYRVYGTGKLFHFGAGGDFYTEYGIQSDYGPWPWQGRGNPEFTAHPNNYEQWKEYLPIYDMHRDLDYAPLSDVPQWKANIEEGTPGATGWFNTKTATPFKYVNAEIRDKLPDEISADFAVDVLSREHQNPFFLGVGFIRPHSPLYVPEKYFNLFPLEEITLPPYLKDDREDCAPMLRDRWEWGFIKYDALMKAGGEKAWKEWVQAYLACIAFVDDQIGRVVDALKNSPYENNTIIVLTSDNGYHVGEKDCIQKWHLWNESTRVPLYVSIPNSIDDNLTCKKPVSLIDLYPTLAEICQLSGNPRNTSSKKFNGRSLVPLLKSPEGNAWGNRPILTAVQANTSKKVDNAHFSVVDDQYRYTLCLDGEEELYDHAKDPNEWLNLSENKDYSEVKMNLKQEMTSIFQETIIPTGFSSPMPGK